MPKFKDSLWDRSFDTTTQVGAQRVAVETNFNVMGHAATWMAFAGSTQPLPTEWYGDDDE